MSSCSATLEARRREGLSYQRGGGRRAWGAAGGGALHRDGLAFTADLIGGQKTGFYCDQRPNRRLAESLAGGRRCSTSSRTAERSALRAARRRARVTHVESAARLNERARRHLADNGLDAAGVHGSKGTLSTRCAGASALRPRGLRSAAAGAPARRPRRRCARLQGPQPPGAAASRARRLPAHLQLQRRGRLQALSPDPLLRGGRGRRRVVLLAPLAAGPDHPSR